MYRKELQALLNSNNFPNFFLLYGNDNFQTELYANFIKKKYVTSELMKLYFEEYNFSLANDYLASSSLFSTQKFLELKFAKKANVKEIKNLITLCKKNADNFLLLELYDESSKQSELEKVFENNFARFFKVNTPNEGVELLMMRAKELDISITQNALFSLFMGFDENLYLAASELNKFQGLKVDEKIIEQYCYSLNTGSFESFFEKLLKKTDLKSELEKILENFNEMAFINFLSSSFLRLFKITLYAKIYGKVDFKDLLGFTPPSAVAKNLSSWAFSLRIEQYKEIFRLLLKVEYELKTQSKTSKKEFLIANLLKLERILKQ